MILISSMISREFIMNSKTCQLSSIDGLIILKDRLYDNNKYRYISK